MELGRLSQPQVGPEGQIKFVRKGSKEDPWSYRKKDKCPRHLILGEVVKGKRIDLIRGKRIFETLECFKCLNDGLEVKWVFDHGSPYWEQEILKIWLQNYRGKDKELLSEKLRDMEFE